jgi:uncharacterized protein
MKGIRLFPVILLSQLLISFTVSAQQKQFKALVVTTTKGWHHESLHAGYVALKEMGVKNFFDVVLWENPGGFNDKYLEQFQLIIFLNTTGDIFNEEQQKAMEKFIQAGKGYVGIHSAADTEYEWPWYTKLVGRMFKIHPAIQSAKMKVLDNGFPGLQGFADGRIWTEEWYDFQPETISGLNYILGVDESTYNPKVQWGNNKSDGMGQLHPLAWYHNYDGGRAFYTALGHLPTNFSDPAFLNHLYAGIFWAATGKK